jgi:hypothetical protein
MHLCAAEQVDEVDVVSRNSGFCVRAFTCEAETLARGGSALQPQVADLDQIEVSFVAEPSQHWQVQQRGGLACADYERSRRIHLDAPGKRGNLSRPRRPPTLNNRQRGGAAGFEMDPIDDAPAVLEFGHKLVKHLDQLEPALAGQRASQAFKLSR